MRDPGPSAPLVDRLRYAAEVESWEYQGGQSAILTEAADTLAELIWMREGLEK